MWIQLAIMVVSAIIQYAMSTKPKAPTPLTLGELSIPTVQQGTPIAVIFGDVWCADAMIAWFGDLATKAIKSKGGKK
jgi:hypothetical protein